MPSNSFSKTRSSAAVGVWLAAVLLLLARGGKVLPVALAVQAALLAGASFLLWRRSSDDALPSFLVFPIFLLAVVQIVSALYSGCVEGALLSAGRFWMAVSFGVLTRWTWKKEHWRLAGVVFASTALLQALLTTAAWVSGHSPVLLLPGNPQYGAFWMMTALIFCFEFKNILRGRCKMGKTARVELVETRAALGENRSSFDKLRMSGPFASISLMAIKWIACALLLAGVVLSGVRSALVGSAVGGMFLLFRRHGMRGALWGVVALGVLVVTVPRPAWNSLLKTDPIAAWKRSDIWAAAGRGILHHPWLGWGPGQFEGAYRLNAVPQEDSLVRFDHSTLFAHNDYLQAAVGAGVPALLLLLWLLAAILRARPEGCSSAEVSFFSGGAFAFFNFPFALPVNVLTAGAVGALAISPSGKSDLSARLLAARRILSVVLAGLSIVPIVTLPSSLAGGPPDLAFYGRSAYFLARGESLMEDPERRAEGERLLQRALRLDPARAEVWRAWSSVLLRRGTSESASGAADALRQSLARHPTNAVWWTDLALLEESRGRSMEASQALHQALRVEPRYAAAAFQLGRLMRQRGEPRKALHWLERMRDAQNRINVDPAELSPYARHILSWNPGAVAAEIDQCRKDIISS